MKKTITVIIALILILATLLAFAGCSQSFGAKNIEAQINDHLKWHRGGEELCVYDVYDGESLVGEYTQSQAYVHNASVKVVTTVEEQNRELTLSSGYEFISSLTATIDGKEYVRYTQSYTNLDLSPVISYSKVVSDQTVEIITTYENKRVNATFIVDGKVSDDSVKTKATLLYDNSYVYQFSRATDLATALSVTIPTYTVNEERTAISASTFTTSYLAGSSCLLDNVFAIERDFISGGENESSTTYGIEDDSHKKSESTDDDGNVTVTYHMTATNIIPATKVTFASTSSSLVTGYIYCYISSYPMRNLDGDTLAERVVVMMQEGKMTYKLNSVVRRNVQ